MRLSGLSSGIKPVKETVLIIISLLFILLPCKIQTQEARLREFNEKGMETELRYGENISKDPEWQNFAQNVKTRMRAGWEAQALSSMMESLGLAQDEAATNGVFLKARADWEAKADRKIEEMFGKWRVKKDWDFQIKGGEIRKLIIETVWSKKDDISNIRGNIEEMLKRVETNWGTYLDLYEAGLNSYLDGLKSGAGALGEEARMNYITGIEETARAQVNAASGLAGQFIKLEEDKYYKYMFRIERYQELVASNSLLFDEMLISNGMNDRITNVLYGASNLDSPLSIALTQIQAIRSNITEIASNLMVPYIPEEDLTVGIRNWEEMVRDQYRSGLEEWNTALSNLYAQMNGWQDRAWTGYTNGWDEWNRALNVMNGSRTEWQAQIETNLNRSMEAWSSNIGSSEKEMLEGLNELQAEIERTGQDYGEYSAGMMNIFLEGSSTLKTINNNLDWIGERLPDYVSKRNEYYNNMTNAYAVISNFIPAYQFYTNSRAALAGVMAYRGVPDVLIPSSVSSTYNYNVSTNITFLYNGYTVTYYHNKQENSYMPYGANGNETITASVTAGGNTFGYNYYTSWSSSDIFPYTSTSSANSIYSCSGPQYNSSDLLKSITDISNKIMPMIASTNDFTKNYNAWNSDTLSLLNEQTRWASMQSNYTAILNSSRSNLQNELYSGQAGTGLFNDSLTGSADLYFRSQKEMDYAQKQEELKYRQERRDIAKAVMDYAVLYGDAPYSESGMTARIESASNSLLLSVTACSNAAVLLDRAQLTAQLAAANVASNSAPLMEAKSAIDAAMKGYETAKRDYEKQQEILGILEEGTSNVIAQGKTFIDRAITRYIAGLEDYNNARDNYYEFYTHTAMEEMARNYYIQLTNTGRNAEGSEAGVLACRDLAETADLADIISNVDLKTAELIADATNGSGGPLGARGRLYSILSLSNSYKEFYEKALDYLKTGDSSGLLEYTTLSQPDLEVRRLSYTGLVMQCVSNFIDSALLPGSPVEDIDAAFKAWQMSSSYADMAGGLDNISIRNILEGALRYIKNDSVLMGSLTNTGWTGDRRSVMAGGMDRWGLVNDFMLSGLERTVENADRFLGSHSGITGKAAGDMTLGEYNGWLGCLLNAGEFSPISGYYDNYIYDIDQSANQASGFFKGLSAQLLSWGKVFFSMKDSGSVSAAGLEYGSTGELEEAVNSVTNLKGLYGEAMDAYIGEMEAKLAAAKMIKEGVYSYDSATNDQNILYNTIAGNMGRADSLKGLIAGKNILNIAYIDAAYLNTAGAEEKIKLQKAAEGIILSGISLATNFAGETELSNYIAGEVSAALGGSPKAGLDIQTITRDIYNDAVRMYITGRTGSTINSGSASGFMLSGFKTENTVYSNFAQSMEDIAFYKSGITNLNTQAVHDYQRLKGLETAFTFAPWTLTEADKADPYYKILEASADYRAYIKLTGGEKTLIDTGNTGAFDYYSQTLLSGNTGILKEYQSYGSLIVTLKQDWAGETAALNARIGADQKTYSENRQTIQYADRISTQKFFKNDSELTAIETASPSNFTRMAGDEFDSAVSNRLAVNIDSGNDGYTELKRMADGFTNLTSKYNTEYNGFTNLINSAVKAYENKTSGFDINKYGFEAFGSLLDSYSGQYEGSFASWNSAALEMTVWAMAIQKANANETNYSQSGEYKTALSAYESANSNVRSAQDNYYTNLDSYNSALSDYYNKLNAVSAGNTNAKALELEKRKNAAVYEYAILPMLLGVRTNSSGAIGITNAIDPAKEYNDYEAVCLSDEAELSNIAREIASEKTLDAAVQAKLDSYAKDYGSYGTLLDLMEKMGEKEGLAYKQMMDAKDNYEEAASGLLGADCGPAMNDPLYAAFSEKVCNGTLNRDDIYNMLNKELGFARQTNGGSLYISQDDILNDFYQYTNGDNKKYEELYRLAFGIRTYDTFTNLAGTAFDTLSNLIKKTPVLSYTYLVYYTKPYDPFTYFSNVTCTYAIDQSILTPGKELNLQKISDILQGIMSFQNSYSSYRPLYDAANNLMTILKPESSYFILNRFPYSYSYVTGKGYTNYGGYGIEYDIYKSVNYTQVYDHYRDTDPADYRFLEDLLSQYAGYNNYLSTGSSLEYGINPAYTLPYYSSSFNNWTAVNGSFNSIGNVQSLRKVYDSANSLLNKYAIDAGSYTNAAGDLDITKMSNGFFKLVCDNMLAAASGDISGLSNIYQSEMDYIARYLSAPGSVKDGKISAQLVLEALEKAAELDLSAQEISIRNDTTNKDETGKLYIEAMISLVSARDDILDSARGDGDSAGITTEAFRKAIEKIYELKKEAYTTAKNEEASLQQEKWNGIMNDLAYQGDSETRMWYNILTTGGAHWNSAFSTMTGAMNKWDTDYKAALNTGTGIWTSKADILTQRREAWLNMSISVVSSGSSEYINDDFQNSIDDSTYSLLNDDLPADVAASVAQKARELKEALMPKNNTAYLDFFNKTISSARENDVKFVMDGISRFGGDSASIIQFNSDMRAFKDNQTTLAVIKMKDDFRENFKKMTEKMNKQIERSDKDAKDKQFTPMAIDQGWTREGSQWVKRGVTIDTSLFSGDKKQDFSFADYFSYSNRMNYEDYAAPDVLEKIKGQQSKYELLVQIKTDEAQKNFEAMIGDFKDKHIGNEGYSSSDAPAKYSGDVSKGETYRITWAMSYYGYLQSVGEQKANSAFWDKPLWDTDPYNVNPGVGSTSPSLFAAGKAIGSAVILVAGSICSWGSASVPLALWVAAFNAGAAMTHDTVNLATGHMKANEYGLSMLKDTISGAASVGTSFIDPTGSLGSALLSTGISATANLATGGLKLNANGQMDWQMDRDQWNNWAMSSAGSMAGAGVNSGLNIGKNIGGWTSDAFGGGDTFLGASFGYGMQKATEGFISSSLSTLGSSYNMFDNSWKAYDWNNVGQSTASAGVNGAVAGAIGSSLGGIYSSENGKMFFENNSDKMQNTMDFFGSIAGQNTRYAMGGTFDIGLGGNLGMSLTHDKGWVRNDSAQGIDLAQGIIAMDTFGVTKGIGNFFGSIGNAIGGGVSWLGQQTINIADGIASTLPFGKNTPADKAMAAMMDNNNATFRDVEGPKFKTVDGREISIYDLPYMKQDMKAIATDASIADMTRMFARTAPTAKELELGNQINKKYMTENLLNDDGGYRNLRNISGDRDKIKVDRSNRQVIIKLDENGSQKVIKFDKNGNAVNDENKTIDSRGMEVINNNYDKNGNKQNILTAQYDTHGVRAYDIEENLKNGYKKINMYDGSGETPFESEYYSMDNGSYSLKYKDYRIVNGDGLAIPYVKQSSFPWGEMYVNGIEEKTMNHIGCVITADSMYLTFMGHSTTPDLFHDIAKEKGAFTGASLTDPETVVSEIIGLKSKFNVDVDSSKFKSTIEERLNQDLPTMLRYIDNLDTSKGHTVIVTGYRVNAAAQISGYLISDPGWQNDENKNMFISKSDMKFNKKPNYSLKRLNWFEW